MCCCRRVTCTLRLLRRASPCCRRVRGLASSIQTPRPRQAFLERSNIQYVQQFENDHIVKLVKAYGHGESINLVFPRAWTNLDHLLRDPTYEYSSKRGLRLDRADAWKQLLGISSALKQMHGYGGEATRRTRDDSGVLGRACIHFDLKPDNILVEREGNWLITDFGQAALTERQRGTTPHVGGHFGTDAYAPPEIDDRSMEVGRAYDVWSLGCIMLEVAAFLVLSYAGLNGTASFMGLDQARQSMPYWTRNRDERFFNQEVPNGAYVVKKEIQAFKTNLESSHTRSNDSDAASRAFFFHNLGSYRFDAEANRHAENGRLHGCGYTF
jgi:serine/threonine protein kinase